jgi:type IV pilus assembly protein PilP
LLVACSDENKDLTHYIHQVKQRKSQSISPLPVFNYEPGFNYSGDENRRNPFKQINQKESDNALASDSRRIKHILEGDSLDTLKFVGTLTQGLQIWGLIKGPDSQITVVHVGDYMGKNNGRILVIKNNLIQLEETIKDSLDRWEKQVTTLDLNLDK